MGNMRTSRKCAAGSPPGEMLRIQRRTWLARDGEEAPRSAPMRSTTASICDARLQSLMLIAFRSRTQLVFDSEGKPQLRGLHLISRAKQGSQLISAIFAS